MDWDDLRYLLALRDHGSQAAAARHLRVDQATVGRRLAGLERAAGAKLVERVAKGMALTVAGERAVEAGRAMDEAVAVLERQLAAGERSVVGRVRIAASETVTSALLAPRLALLRRGHPALDVELLASNQIVSLSRGEADVALRLVRPEQPTLAVRRLAGVAFAAYASRGYRRSRGRRAPLAAHDLLGYDASLWSTPHGSWLERVAPGARFPLRSNSTQALLEAALAGNGVAVLPCYLGDPEPRLVRVVDPEPASTAELWLVVHQDLQRAPRVRAAIGFIDAVVAETAALLRGEGRRGAR